MAEYFNVSDPFVEQHLLGYNKGGEDHYGFKAVYLIQDINTGLYLLQYNLRSDTVLQQLIEDTAEYTPYGVSAEQQNFENSRIDISLEPDDSLILAGSEKVKLTGLQTLRQGRTQTQFIGRVMSDNVRRSIYEEMPAIASNLDIRSIQLLDQVKYNPERRLMYGITLVRANFTKKFEVGVPLQANQNIGIQSRGMYLHTIAFNPYELTAAVGKDVTFQNVFNAAKNPAVIMVKNPFTNMTEPEKASTYQDMWNRCGRIECEMPVFVKAEG